MVTCNLKILSNTWLKIKSHKAAKFWLSRLVTPKLWHLLKLDFNLKKKKKKKCNSIGFLGAFIWKVFDLDCKLFVNNSGSTRAKTYLYLLGGLFSSTVAICVGWNVVWAWVGESRPKTYTRQEYLPKGYWGSLLCFKSGPRVQTQHNTTVIKPKIKDYIWLLKGLKNKEEICNIWNNIWNRMWNLELEKILLA